MSARGQVIGASSGQTFDYPEQNSEEVQQTSRSRTSNSLNATILGAMASRYSHEDLEMGRRSLDGSLQASQSDGIVVTDPEAYDEAIDEFSDYAERRGEVKAASEAQKVAIKRCLKPGRNEELLEKICRDSNLLDSTVDDIKNDVTVSQDRRQNYKKWGSLAALTLVSGAAVGAIAGAIAQGMYGGFRSTVDNQPVKRALDETPFNCTENAMQTSINGINVPFNRTFVPDLKKPLNGVNLDEIKTRFTEYLTRCQKNPTSPFFDCKYLKSFEPPIQQLIDCTDEMQKNVTNGGNTPGETPDKDNGETKSKGPVKEALEIGGGAAAVATVVTAALGANKINKAKKEKEGEVTDEIKEKIKQVKKALSVLKNDREQSRGQTNRNNSSGRDSSTENTRSGRSR